LAQRTNEEVESSCQLVTAEVAQCSSPPLELSVGVQTQSENQRENNIHAGAQLHQEKVPENEKSTK